MTFRPPHDFECPVCFPPEDRPALGFTVILLGFIGGVTVVLWLVGGVR